MGKSFFHRRITKPLTRFAFAKGKQFTTYYIELYCTKYLKKYIVKRDKMCLGFHFTPGTVEAIAVVAVGALMGKQVETEEELVNMLKETAKDPTAYTHSAARTCLCISPKNSNGTPKIVFSERKHTTPHAHGHDHDSESDVDSDEEVEVAVKKSMEESLEDIAM